VPASLRQQQQWELDQGSSNSSSSSSVCSRTQLALHSQHQVRVDRQAANDSLASCVLWPTTPGVVWAMNCTRTADIRWLAGVTWGCPGCLMI